MCRPTLENVPGLPPERSRNSWHDDALGQIVGLDLVIQRQLGNLWHHRPVACHHAFQEPLMPKMVEAQFLAVALAGACEQRKGARSPPSPRSAVRPPTAAPLQSRSERSRCWKAYRRRGSGRLPRRLSRSCCARILPVRRASAPGRPRPLRRTRSISLRLCGRPYLAVQCRSRMINMPRARVGDIIKPRRQFLARRAKLFYIRSVETTSRPPLVRDLPPSSRDRSTGLRAAKPNRGGGRPKGSEGGGLAAETRNSQAGAYLPSRVRGRRVFH